MHIGSLFNHSCDPNTSRINVGSATVLVATRTIAAGEEVSDIYSMHHSEIPQRQRGGWLEKNFFFTCGCQACQEGYATYDELPEEACQFSRAFELHSLIFAYFQVPKATLDQLRQVERALATALRSSDAEGAVRLHCKDIQIIEGSVVKPHKLYVSHRNSFQFALWLRYGRG